MAVSQISHNYNFNFFIGIIGLLGFSIGFYVLANFSFFKEWGTSPLLLGLVGGILLSRLIPLSLLSQRNAALKFASKPLLRFGIALLGFKITIPHLIELGLSALIIDLIIVFSTFFLGVWLGKKLGLESEISMLTSIGAAVCGAAAVLGLEAVLRSSPHKSAVALGTVVTYGLISMLLYPLCIDLFGFSSHQMGIFLGASIHEVAQVLVAGHSISPEVTHVAILTKMGRVLLLMPLLLILGMWFKGRKDKDQTLKSNPPFFILGFFVCIVIGSIWEIKGNTALILEGITALILTASMFAIGLQIRSFKTEGQNWKPFLLGSILMLWLAFASVFLIKLLVT